MSRSKDFRYIYTNTSRIQFAPNEITFLFGIKEDQSEISDEFLEEVGIIMSHTSAKLLAHTLTRIIEQAERATGSQIFVDPSKYTELENAIRVADEQHAKLKAALAKV